MAVLIGCAGTLYVAPGAAAGLAWRISASSRLASMIRSKIRRLIRCRRQHAIWSIILMAMIALLLQDGLAAVALHFS